MKRKVFANKYLYFLLMILLPVIAFFLLQPNLSTKYSEAKRQERWNSFVKQMDTKKRMDTKMFWELREFYAPGSFVFKREGFPQLSGNAWSHQLGLPSLTKEGSLLFLQFRSDYFSSWEWLIAPQISPEFFAAFSKLAEKYPVLARGENYLIIKIAPQKAILLFVANGKEMKQANGFFDYQEKDIELVKNKEWLNISEISY